MALTLVNNLVYSVLLTTSLFTTLLSLLKSTGTTFNLSTSKSSTSDFNLAKSALLAKSDVSTHVGLNLLLLHN